MTGRVRPESWREARYYEKAGQDRVRCRLCPVNCSIPPGGRGRCRARTNIDGVLYASSYGRIVALALDPIEKKPLYHFYPGRTILSVAPNACNLVCPFCQNWQISQTDQPTRPLAPDELVRQAGRNGSIGVAYTYTEPLVWFEYLLDVFPRIRSAGLKNVLVTNGLIEPEPLAELLPWVDAMNIDLKSIRPDFYKKIVRGDLAAVLRTIERAKQSCHVEVTNLVIPTLNDSPAEIDELVRWLAALGRDTVLHFSRYFPHYQSDLPATPAALLLDAARRARAHLDYVYLGNIGSDGRYSDTRCPGCRTLQVRRTGSAVEVVNSTERCPEGNGLRFNAPRNTRCCTTCGRPVDLVL